MTGRHDTMTWIAEEGEGGEERDADHKQYVKCL